MEMYQATLVVGIESFSFVKLFSHNVAEYSPTDIQTSQQTVVSHNMAAWATTLDEWTSIVDSSCPLLEGRHEQKKLVQKRGKGGWKRARKQKPMITKNAAPVAVPKRRVKRHTFNKVRVT